MKDMLPPPPPPQPAKASTIIEAAAHLLQFSEMMIITHLPHFAAAICARIILFG